jgi:uncharacterized LabA/DUF88 family protein
VAESSDSPENATKRVIFFFDVQNLFHSAKEAFDVDSPNFDPVKLANHFCAVHGWSRCGIRFYTGIPVREYQPRWADYWSKRLRRLGNQKAILNVFTTLLRYRERVFPLPVDRQDKWFRLSSGNHSYIHQELFDRNGQPLGRDVKLHVRVPQEKQIDVKIAIDLVMMTFETRFDVAVIFSQDDDISQAVTSAKTIARSQGRVVEFFSAFPEGTTYDRGIQGTNNLCISRDVYEACVDPKDYFDNTRQ